METTLEYERDTREGYQRVRGQEGVATPCCYSGINKGLKNTLLFSYYYIRPLHGALPGNGNMEVLTLKNRMSAIKFLLLYFSENVITRLL